MLSTTLTVQPRSELIGMKFGIQINGSETIYVSPVIYSLFKTDLEAMIKTLVVKEMDKNDPNNPLIKKKFKSRHRSYGVTDQTA